VIHALNIVEYLCKEARKITNTSLRDIRDKNYWLRSENERRRMFISMLGLSKYLSEERPPIEYHVTGVIEREGYRIEKIYFQSLPGLYVTGNLYIPEDIKGSLPAVLYLCGHSFNQKHHYQFHGHKFAKLGFVTLIVETIQKGEIRGHHHGTYHYGWFNWYSLGYTPAGVEVWNAIRAVDLLQEFSFVDKEKIGITGISGGGAMSWFVAAVDKRIKVVAPVCSTGTIESHICKRTLDHHCDCMFWINNYMWDLTDVGALIAPRPLLIASAVRDWIYDIESVRLIYNKLKKLYDLLGAPENILLVEAPGGHAYHEVSRRMIFKWFIKHLKNVDMTLEEIGLIDEEPIEEVPLEDLRVFDKIPFDERVTTVQDWFIRPASPPEISSPDELKEYKERLKQALYRETFSAFPKEPCDLSVNIELIQESDNSIGYRISFVPEEGWKLHMQIIRPKGIKKPVPIMVFLARSARNITHGDELINGLDRRWARAFVEVRGIGETSWSTDIQWFVRRASMLVGRTIASMRIYDAIRAIDAICSLSWVDRGKVAIMGSGEMAVVALYTAFLRGDIRAVVLHNPPPTHNIPSNPDGSGMAIELLNVLRYTDLPVIAGLLWPSELVFLGPRPNTYVWAEELYRKLGPPGSVKHVKRIADWKLSEEVIG